MLFAALLRPSSGDALLQPAVPRAQPSRAADVSPCSAWIIGAGRASQQPRRLPPSQAAEERRRRRRLALGAWVALGLTLRLLPTPVAADPLPLPSVARVFSAF